ncbi:MAG TPA: phospholipid carrier-dependent glycosyltransferase, partial [Chloroflexota bacterium]|nr:phospholipid carrier-dependent glycosyltransferase [Chloroflexota bacterium]
MTSVAPPISPASASPTPRAVPGPAWPRTRRRLWAPPVPLLLFVFLLAVYLVTGGGKGYSIDGAFGYEMARSAFLDPEHSYFRRFRTAFARWGALMPLLGQPFVLAGDALARVAPERDEVVAAGHRFRVEQWPSLGAAGQASYSPPAPQTGGEAVRSLAIVSFLANGLAVPQGAIVGEVRLWGGGTEVLLPLRAGVETAEWAIDRPDVAGQAGHRRAQVAGHWIGQPRGNLYLALLDLPRPLVVEGWELRPGPASGATQLHLRAAAFRTAEGWVDVHTGERFWSARETRDFFTRFLYATLNAFTTAGAAVLVYALARRFEYSTTVSALAALGFGLGTMAWPYARLDFSEPAATLFVLLAVWAFYQACPPSVPGPKSEGRAGQALVAGLLGAGSSGALLLAIAGKYTSALFGLALVVQWALSSAWWRPQRRRHALTYLGALALPLLILGAAGVGMAFAFTGEVPIVLSPAQVLSRIGEDWLALPIWTGLRGLLFSPGRSLFLYSPWLLLAIPGVVLFMRRHGRSGFLVAVFPILVVLLYAMKLGWHGGSWGPRYLLPVVPLLAVACAPALMWLLQRGQVGRFALAGLAACAVGVQFLGLAKDPERYPAMVREFVVPALPDGGSRLGGRDYWLARGGPGLGRALQDPTPGGKGRGLGYL